MTIPLDNYKSTPLGSLLTKARDLEEKYIQQIVELPPNLMHLVMTARTGAFIRGLTKTFDVPLEKAPQIAFAVLRIAVGEKPLGQLGGILSAELPLPNDKAQKMAQEIEKELFGPVMLEFNQFLTQKKAIKPSIADKMRVAPQNVINLKNRGSVTSNQ